MSQPLARFSRLFRLRRALLVVLALCALAGWFLPPVLSGLLADANAADLPPIKGANYKQAYKYSGEFLKQYTYSTSVSPKWFGKSDTFWYQYSTSKGTQWYRVNPRDATREPLFDRVKLGAQLSELVRKPLDPSRLPIANGSINAEGTKFKFVTENLQFEYDLQAEKLVSLGKAAPPPAGPGGLDPKKKEALQELLGNDRYFALMEKLEKLENGEITFEEASLEEWLADLDMYFPEFQTVLSNIQKALDEPNAPQKKGGKGKGAVDPEQKKDAQKATDPKVYAPNGKMYAYVLNHNLYVAEEGKEDSATKLSTDGAPQYSFGAGAGAGKGGKGGGKGGDLEEQKTKGAETGKEQKARPAVTWAKDSKSFYVTRADNRAEIKQLFLVNSVANPRPTLQSYNYAMPGEQLRTTELYTFHVANKKLARVDPKWKDERYSDMHWSKSPNELRFQRKDRLQRTIEFCSLNTQTGECKCLFMEAFENVHVSTQPRRELDESNELIWWSERSNWGHYYLYDRNSGKLKNPITTGDFRASAIVQLDTKNRVLYFRGNAREPGENVYFNHLYSVNFDGNNLTLLDPGDGNHNSELSPSRQYVVDNYSRFDMAPVSVLRDARGNKLMDLEKTDLSKLYEVGWRMPETFVVKAADGVTDLYGHMWKPFDFDPKKKYPIIAHVYPGPQTESMTHQFSSNSQQQQLAQLNFIVIQVGNRGGTPLRSKNYQSHSYWNMRDYGLADKKTALEQLGARFDFVDLERIGIYGHSGGGFMSTAALLVKPYNEFFKVAVSSAGNHDNNIYNSNWSEQYHGLKEVAGEKSDAKKDDGKKGLGKGAGKGGGKKKGSPDDFDGPQMGKKKGDVKKDDVKKDDVKKDEQKSDKKDDMKDAKKDEQKSDKKDDAKAKGPTHFEIRVPTNPELAANLKGKLLLVHGDMDNNVHPAMTIRMADALIKANKRFDLLIMPGQAHGFGPMQAYFNQRMWEYFAQHLLDDHPTSADLYDKKRN